ncbi:hypothetical protein BU17DRAFT_87571 [Hysterangium stoloniferum]|nr:hypothetical protein BU17DRAFT_87571 [Hysterangium stoloniferum]
MPISPMAGHSPNEPLLALTSPLSPNDSSSQLESHGSMSRLISDNSRMPLGVSPGGYLFLGARESSVGSWGSILLYRLASDSDPWDNDPRMSPSQHPWDRFSMGSDSGLSVHSIPSGLKCPTEKFNTGGKGTFLAYVYDPSQDQNGLPDAEDIMHGPETLDHDEGFRLSISGAVLTSPSSYFSYYTHLSFHSLSYHHLPTIEYAESGNQQ